MDCNEVLLLRGNVATMGPDGERTKMDMVDGSVVYCDPGYISLLAQVGMSAEWPETTWLRGLARKQDTIDKLRTYIQDRLLRGSWTKASARELLEGTGNE